MNVTPFPVVHIQVPTWACVIALLILAAALAWDVYGAPTSTSSSPPRKPSCTERRP